MELRVYLMFFFVYCVKNEFAPSIFLFLRRTQHSVQVVHCWRFFKWTMTFESCVEWLWIALIFISFDWYLASSAPSSDVVRQCGWWISHKLLSLIIFSGSMFKSSVRNLFMAFFCFFASSKKNCSYIITFIFHLFYVFLFFYRRCLFYDFFSIPLRPAQKNG